MEKDERAVTESWQQEQEQVEWHTSAEKESPSEKKRGETKWLYPQLTVPNTLVKSFRFIVDIAIKQNTTQEYVHMEIHSMVSTSSSSY